MPNKYYINDVTTPTIDLRSQIQKELRSLERKCNIRVANKETRFSDLKDNKNFYEHVEEEYEGALLLVFQKMKIKNYKEYKLLLGMFYHDFCLINNNEENDFYNEEKQIFEEFKSSVKNMNDLLNQIETVPSYICDFISSFEEFQKMSYFNKRKLFLDNKDLNDYLKKFFPAGITRSGFTYILAKPSSTTGVVITVPHVGICTSSVTTKCTLRYNPAPGYQREDSRSFSRRTASSFFSPGFR